MNRILENNKLDMALKPQALNNSNVTGEYFPMKGKEEGLFILQVGAMAAAKTAKLEIYQAKDNDGTDAEVIQDSDGDSIAASITANTKVQEVTIDVSSVANTDIVKINNIEFEAASITSASSKEFADATGLKACIGHSLPELAASVDTNTVTVKSAEPGEEVITVSKEENAGTITLATVRAQAFISVPAQYMKDGFTHLAAKVTTTANSVVAVPLLAGNPIGRTPDQKVGAYQNINADSF